MNKMKRLQKAIFICTIMALLITGCGKNADSRKEDVVQEINDIDGEKSGTGQTLPAMLEVDEESWVEEFAVAGGNLHTIKIGATVKIPDVDNMGILTLEEQNLDADRKKAILETICTEGEIHGFDDDMMPKSFYEEQIEIVRGVIENLLAAQENGSGMSHDGSWGSEDEQLLKDYQQDLDNLEKKYKEAVEAESSNATEAEIDYSTYNNYTGMTDTDSAIVYFHPEENFVSWDTEDLRKVCSKEGNINSNDIGLGAEETDHGNLCKMSEEEAKNYAVSYAAKLGYDEYVVADVKYLTWQNYAAEGFEQWTDGYEITLAREVNGVPVDYANYNSMQYGNVNTGEYIQLRFNDMGMIHGTINHPRKIKEITAESTLLLSYKQVKDVVKSHLIEKAEDYGKEIETTEDSLSFSDMELIYYALRDEAQGIVIIPAWRLSSLEFGFDYSAMQHPLLINAIDGNWIDVWEGMEPAN